MNDLALHHLTEQQLQGLATAPPHGILLHAPPGSGKYTLAKRLAAAILQLKPDALDTYPYLRTISSDDGRAIGIEAVRLLEHFLSLKVPRPKGVSRIVIISDAHLLTVEAQNALLKTLEEPPTGTVLLLTASSEQALLPTVRSRLQATLVKRPPEAALKKFFGAAGHSQASVNQAYAISGGLPGLMAALLTNTDHPLQPATELARQLLQRSTYERLLLVDQLAKQRAQAVEVLFILQQMAHSRLQTSTGAQFKRWQKILTASYDATEQLQGNAQPKLVLDQLMLMLG